MCVDCRVYLKDIFCRLHAKNFGNVSERVFMMWALIQTAGREREDVDVHFENGEFLAVERYHLDSSDQVKILSSYFAFALSHCLMFRT